MLITYLRDDDNVPHGCFVSDGLNRLGMSFCNKEDKFIKKVGVELAVASMTTPDKALEILVDRIEAYKGKNPAVTAVDVIRLLEFRDRIKKYYKEELC